MSAHHDPEVCWSCGQPTEKRHGSGYNPGEAAWDIKGEPYWWCGRCCMGMVCACEACQVLRVLAAMDGPLT